MINAVSSTNTVDIEKSIDTTRSFKNFDLAHTYVNMPMFNNVAPTDNNLSNTNNGEKDDKKDKNNDGKIGFWKAAGNFALGVGKFFWGMFSDEEGNFDLGQTLKTLAIGAGIATLSALVPGAGAAIALGFLGHGALGMTKSIYNIATAKTDEEDALAWENFGSSATETTLAFFGAKKSGAFKKGQNVYDSVKTSGKTVYDSYKNGGWTEAKATAINEGTKGYNYLKTNVYEQAKTNWENLTDKTKLNLEKIKRTETESNDIAFNEGIDAIKGKTQSDALSEIRDLQRKVRIETDETLKSQAQAKLDGATKAYKESMNHNQYAITDEAFRESEITRLDSKIKDAKKEVSQTAKDLANAKSELAKNTADTDLQTNVEILQKQLKSSQDELAAITLEKQGIKGSTIKYSLSQSVKDGIRTDGYKWITLSAAGRGYKDAA